MSHSSSSHHHSHHKPESKGIKFARNFLAFMLFASILLLSLSACSCISFVNEGNVARIFTNEKYVISLHDDILQYAYDECDEAGIPYDSVDACITYDLVYDITTAYAQGNLCNNAMFTDTSYQSKADEFNTALTDSTAKMLKAYKLSAGSDDIETFSQRISDYVKEKTEFVYLDKLQTITNIGTTASIVICIASVIITAVLATSIIFTGNKKYRGMRAISYSLVSSSVFQFIMIAVLEIIEGFKNLWIYPVYLRESVMSYIGRCENTVFLSAITSFVLALVVMTFVWKSKKES